MQTFQVDGPLFIIKIGEFKMLNEGTSVFGNRFFTNQDLEKRFIATLALNKNKIYLSGINPAWFQHERENLLKIKEALANGLPPPIFDGEIIKDPSNSINHLKELYEKRCYADPAFKFIDNLKSETISLKDALTELNNKFSEIKAPKKTIKLTTIDDVFPIIYEKLKAHHEKIKLCPDYIPGIRTGLSSLDEALGGYLRGLIVLAAEPGCGKTTWCLIAALIVAAQGIPVIFISFEESLEKLATFVLCGKEGLGKKDFWEGREDPESLKSILERYKNELKNIFFVNALSAKVGVEEIESLAQEAMKKAGTDKAFIVIDYLQNMTSRNSTSNTGEYRLQIGNFLYSLKDLSERISSPIFVISSQNRAGQDKSE